MSKAKIVLSTLAVFGVVFAGVTAALKFNDWQKSNASIFSKSGSRDGWFENVKFETQGSNSADFRIAAKKILPSVVSIDTQVEGENFFGERVVNSGKGSGVVITADGYIVTNNHVVRVREGFGNERVVDKVRVTLSEFLSRS